MCLLVSSFDIDFRVYSDSGRHLRELSFLPYGHPKTGIHTVIFSDVFALLSPSLYDLSDNYILTNNNYDAAVNRTPDLIVGGT